MSRKIVKSRIFFEEDFEESLAEVPAQPVKAWGPDADLSVVGKPHSRIDGYDKVSGSATYTFDKILPNMAYARTLRCPHPHARIKRIDTSRAEQLPGVLAVIAHHNVPRIPWYGRTSYLFDPHLRYEGDEVACVAAESEAIAEEALKRIDVEYEILPFVVEAGEAMKEDAPKVHDTGNIMGGRPSTYQRGDVDKGFSEADVVVEDTYTTQIVVHNPAEPHCSVVNWDGDRLTVWDSTQGVFTVRDTVASALGIPASHVRVIKKYMGGGFGSKLAAGKYTVMAALLAKRIGRPVKIVLDRRELNLAVGNRPDSVQTLKLGAKKDGTLTAMQLRSYGASGAYPSSARLSWPFRQIYKCPNSKVEEYTVFINAGPGRPHRAPGHVQGTFALEAMMDTLAEKLGMDPLEFRMKNYAEVDPVSGNPYTTKRLRECYEKGAEAIGWHRRRKVPGSDPGPVKRGIGMATQIWWGSGGPPCYAVLKLNRDGSARVICGSQDIGTGTYTVVAMIAAEVLEIPVEKVTVVLGDTAVGPYAGSSGGSNTVASVGPAVRDAAEQMKAKLISGAAAILGVPENELEYRKGVIRHLASDGKELTIGQVVRRMRERVLITTGAREANPQGYAINTFGAQFAEVEVDTLTGEIRVLKVVAAHDVGRIINPKTARNQFYGGIIQGLGIALMEERVIDRNTGKVLSTNLHDYKIPTVSDAPEIEVLIVSDSDPLINNIGVKGIGEPAIIPTPAAIANAVYNAIGVRIKSLPITPDKVLAALSG
jgi:xanthine dehydrogenase YagR molybdenum-binding subunit